MRASATDAGRDDVAQILGARQALARNASSPVIRLCQEEVRKDIAHPAGGGDEYRDAGEAEAA